jgi:pimeloyl-ACP methyl ester carboxylesterase
VLLLNAGLLHRVGPNRLYVRLARALAGHGFRVLRFDLSSVGDSEVRRDELSLPESVVRDAQDAMDFLAGRTDVDRFVVIGLCEGAENTFRVTVRDPRVVGAALLDGFAYRTFGYYLRRYGGRALAPGSWWRLITGESDFVRSLWRRSKESTKLSSRDRPPAHERYPPPATALADLERLVARGVRLQFVYTGGGMRERYNYARQFWDMFPSLRGCSQIQVTYMSATDRTFTLVQHQDEVTDIVESWMCTTFPVHAASNSSRELNGRKSPTRRITPGSPLGRVRRS